MSSQFLLTNTSTTVIMQMATGSVTVDLLGASAVTSAKVLDGTLEALDMSAAVNNRLNVKPTTVGALAVDNGVSWGETASGIVGQVMTNTGATTPTWEDAPVGQVSGGYVDRSGTSLRYLPDVSNRCWCYENNVWVEKVIPDAGITAPATGLTANTTYTLFVYDNSGTLTLDMDSGNNTVTQNGIRVKAGATSRTALALCFAPTHGVTNKGQILTLNEDAKSQTLCNFYNKRPVTLVRQELTDSWTYATAAFRSANNSTTNRVTATCDGANEIVCTVNAMAAAASGNLATVGVGVDSTTVDSSQNRVSIVSATGVTIAVYFGVPAASTHFFQWLESSPGATTDTFFGDNTGATGQCQSALILKGLF